MDSGDVSLSRERCELMGITLDTAKAALDLTTSGATTIQAIIGTIRALEKNTQTPQATPEPEIAGALETLKTQVLEAQEQNIALRKAILELEQECLELKRATDKFVGYELWKTPAGHLVYKSGAGIEPVHYLCPSCHDAGIKSILHGNGALKACKHNSRHGSFRFELRNPNSGWAAKRRR
ncbi:hypothetical protein GCM10007921_18350 [Tritonibacter mobilis]|uniref:hypothetical protein n=2 Tax=Tritonibacter mobilis TaxID=379347 RepID=UPI000806D2B8|nr:hypothetical protein [Tritonibacter mobilis]GLP86275.1 hypothetical protein GCM10007921_18350 [Tritonibacter mobilis]SDX17238.1 hypothetical protein SAMN05444385_105187 [Tritonibacter mobilis]